MLCVSGLIVLRKPAWSIYFFFFNDTATTEIYTLSLHDALPISFGSKRSRICLPRGATCSRWPLTGRSEEHTSELQSQSNLVCRLLLEKKKKLHRNFSLISINQTYTLYMFNIACRVHIRHTMSHN